MADRHAKPERAVLIVETPLLPMEYDVRYSIVTDSKLTSCQLFNRQSLILWKNYYSLESFLVKSKKYFNQNTEHVNTGINEMLLEFVTQYADRAIQIWTQFDDDAQSKSYDLHTIELVNHVNPSLKIYMKLHDMTHEHPTYGRYAAWSTYWC